MAYNAAIDNIYNHYLTTYAPKGIVSKYDTHKKSELRGIYNSMLQLNKDAPLYILDSSDDSRKFVVGLKENARELRNTIASLGASEEGQNFARKIAYSTDENMASVEYIGDDEADSSISFNIEVTQLAKGQTNLGYALPSEKEVGLSPDTYSFDLSINDLSYEFQFNIREGDTNKDVQERLARLVNNADIGIDADVLENGKGSSALRLSSVSEGLRPGKEFVFTISDNKTSKSSGSVEYFGIDYVSDKPSNAHFLLNGEERTASSNHFTIDKKFELTLNGIHDFEGQTAGIGVKTDLDSITENVKQLFEGYNKFINTASTYRQGHPASSKLLGEMNNIISYYKEDMEGLGLEIGENGNITVNDNSFQAALSSDSDYSETLKPIKSFSSAMMRKVNQISLNPMEYVDKTVVAYKNPGHNFTAPYVSSNYSGLLFSSYC